MNKIYVPSTEPEDWIPLLAEKDKHWRTGFSAKTLAYSWSEANGFPKMIENVFKKSGIDLFQNVELLLAIPEYKVILPGGSRPSQNDIFILGRSGKGGTISIMVEGKVDETFDKTVDEWRKESGVGKKERLEFLTKKLGIQNKNISAIRYQLLHRTVSALIEAERFNAKSALMLVHSFSANNSGFNDYSNFLRIYGIKGEVDSILFAKLINGINLYFSWVKGDNKYLKR